MNLKSFEDFLLKTKINLKQQNIIMKLGKKEIPLNFQIFILYIITFRLI